MTIRLSLLLTLALSGLLAPVADAQQTSQGSTNAAATSPYTQKQPQAYTSMDNPYAPGGIYDPYRSSKLSNNTQGSSVQSQAKKPKFKGLKSARTSTAASILGGGGLGIGSGQGSSGVLGSSKSQCGGNRYGSSAGSGPGTNRQGAGSIASRSSSMSSCTGSVGLAGGGLSQGSRNMSSMGKRQGMNGQGQAAGMRQQQMTQLQRLPQ